jgi:hypothetical protein
MKPYGSDYWLNKSLTDATQTKKLLPRRHEEHEGKKNKTLSYDIQLSALAIAEGTKFTVFSS